MAQITSNTRVSDRQIFERNQNNIRAVMSEIGKTSQQESDGIKTKKFYDVENQNDVGNLIQIARASSISKKVSDNLIDVKSRMNIVFNTFDQIDTSISFLLESILAATDTPHSDSSLNFSLKEVAENFLAELGGHLQTQFNNIYIFSGSKNVSPVGDLTSISNLYDPDDINTATDNYYFGDYVTPEIPISSISNRKAQWTITAANPFFVKLIGACHYIISAEIGNTLDSDKARIASGTISQARNILNDAKISLGYNQASIDSNITFEQTVQSYLDDSYKQINAVDLAQSMTSLSEEMAHIQALYKSSIAIQKLSLSDYITV